MITGINNNDVIVFRSFQTVGVFNVNISLGLYFLWEGETGNSLGQMVWYAQLYMGCF